MKRVMLLTQANRRALPPLYSQDGQGLNATAYVKLFDPAGRYTFYVTEFDGDDTLFGYCVSPLGADCDELAYASLAELEAVHTTGQPIESGRIRLPLERDRYFTPQPIAAAIQTGA